MTDDLARVAADIEVLSRAALTPWPPIADRRGT